MIIDLNPYESFNIKAGNLELNIYFQGNNIISIEEMKTSDSITIMQPKSTDYSNCWEIRKTFENGYDRT